MIRMSAFYYGYGDDGDDDALGPCLKLLAGPTTIWMKSPCRRPHEERRSAHQVQPIGATNLCLLEASCHHEVHVKNKDSSLRMASTRRFQIISDNIDHARLRRSDSSSSWPCGSAKSSRQEIWAQPLTERRLLCPKTRPRASMA